MVSAIRIAVKGEPTRFVDLGPDSPHKPTGSIPGGALVVAESARARDLRLQRAAMAMAREIAREASARAERELRASRRRSCGRWVILARAECGRKAGHGGPCS